MQREAGARHGAYELLSPIGEGGMGEVWRARDTRLGRTVAIKFLGRNHSGSPAARERLKREAEAVAALAHPHICTLYDVGESGDETFLVMEHLSGETLADRLRNGPLPTQEAVQVGAQIASALAAAHAAGIVHRDLKPGNVMLIRTGVKLLDFGLARVAAPPPGPNDATALKPLTAEGTIVGTLQYMSPEQLEGKELDARSDLFSFGCVLYEMLTGRRAFDGDSRASIVAKVMTSEPPALTEVQPLAPAALERLVRSCLAKDPRDRWQSAADLATALGVVWASPPVPAPGRPEARTTRLWLIAALAAIALATAAFFAGRARAPKPVPMRFAVHPQGSFGGSAVTSWLAVSPDGRRIAFVARDAERTTRLWVRALDSVAAQPIPGTEDAASPFWSPDGRELGFFADRALKRVALGGGAPVTIAEPGEGTAAWLANDTIVFGIWTEKSSHLWRVSGRGGVPVPLTRLGEKETWHYWPSALPDGERVLFLRYKDGAKPQLCAVSVRDGAITPIADVQSRAAYAHPNRLLHVRGRTLVAQPFDPRSLRLDGDAVTVADQIRNFAATSEAPFSVSADGRVIAFHAGETLSRLVWVSREGARRDATSVPHGFDSFRMSRDGKRVVASIVDPAKGTADLWLIHLQRDVETQLTFTDMDERYPMWTADEQQIVFRGHQPEVINAINMFSMPARGGAATKLLERDGLHVPQDAFGRLLLFNSLEGESMDLRVMNLDDRSHEPFTATPAGETGGRFSPDGKWIAYVSNETKRNEVYVQPFPPTGEKWRVSSAGGAVVRWRGDGRELFYLAPDQTLMSVAVEPGGGFGTPVALLREPDLAPGGYDVTADGRQFLMNLAVMEEKKLPLTVAVDWR